MKVAISTLGCKVNQFESQAMEKLFEESGCEIVPASSQADAYIINTCSVTAESDRKSRQLIRRFKNKNAVIAVCGCFSQIHKEDAAGLGIDVLYGTNDKAGFVKAVIDSVYKNNAVIDVDDVFKRRDFERLPSGRLLGRTRAMLKVQDGCVNFCTYCIIPYTRGVVRSLPMEDAIEQVKHLWDDGCREVVITGIEIASYGRDLKDDSGLVSLTAGICGAVSDMRVRLGSLEPRAITEDFCQRLVRCRNLCDHFHISLQSGSDSVLKRMGRKYDTNRFLESITLLRRYWPGCAITADLIVGFPGETESEFEETLSFIRKCRFSSMHIFPYSKRPGTKAAEMEGQILKAEKERRAFVARQVANEMRKEYLTGCIGKVYPVLFEKGSVGHAPNYVEIKVASEENLKGKVYRTQIISVEDDRLNGRILK